MAATRVKSHGREGARSTSHRNRPLLGRHCSTSGGLHRAFGEAAALGTNTMQIFTRNNMTWSPKPLSDDAIQQWHAAAAEHDVDPVVAHDSYLINLAAPDEDVFARSCAAFADELGRCATLGIPYLVMHPGSPKGRTEAWGVNRIAEALRRLLDEHASITPMVLLENTAGQGAQLGHTFEQLAALVERIDRSQRIGVCLDTCHLFAAGYDVSRPRGWHRTIDRYAAVLDIELIRCIHVNDAKRPLGSRVDRHEHLGHGHLGERPFRALMRDPRFADVPKLLETPKKAPDGRPMDSENLALLRRHATRVARESVR